MMKPPALIMPARAVNSMTAAPSNADVVQTSEIVLMVWVMRRPESGADILPKAVVRDGAEGLASGNPHRRSRMRTASPASDRMFDGAKRFSRLIGRFCRESLSSEHAARNASCGALRFRDCGIASSNEVLDTANNSERRLAPFILQVTNKAGVFQRFPAEGSGGHPTALKERVDF
ncbi:hypothetical protein [Bradyrhizobium prioriisuperbiae]|uniref:hypothetical protein n=1 Tax=Bradyrhizobium prioriisuperbiae TaxID=2854389 RepID=UPI0028E5A6E9|nr:hypothetical protein [Bradyrhizobium prioritasuperba]